MISKKMLIFSNLVIVIIMLVISSFIYFSLSNKMKSISGDGGTERAIPSEDLDFIYNIYNINKIEDVDIIADKNKSYDEMIKEENYPSFEQVKIDIYNRTILPSLSIYLSSYEIKNVQLYEKYEYNKEVISYIVINEVNTFVAYYKLFKETANGEVIYRWRMIKATTISDMSDYLLTK